MRRKSARWNWQHRVMPVGRTSEGGKSIIFNFDDKIFKIIKKHQFKYRFKYNFLDRNYFKS